MKCFSGWVSPWRNLFGFRILDRIPSQVPHFIDHIWEIRSFKDWIVSWSFGTAIVLETTRFSSELIDFLKKLTCSLEMLRFRRVLTRRLRAEETQVLFQTLSLLLRYVFGKIVQSFLIAIQVSSSSTILQSRRHLMFFRWIVRTLPSSTTISSIRISEIDFTDIICSTFIFPRCFFKWHDFCDSECDCSLALTFPAKSFQPQQCRVEHTLTSLCVILEFHQQNNDPMNWYKFFILEQYHQQSVPECREA